jgi:hypothetical protein
MARLRAPLSPALGLAVVSLVAIAGDALGLRPSGAGAFAVVGLALLAGVAAAMLAARSRSADRAT